jgi:hypothetical protein
MTKARLIGKTSAPDHSWPGKIDHYKRELDACYFLMYVLCYQTGF